MPDTVTLSCPKCAASMRSYERNGVTIEQCVECRGVFLDRGELDHLIDAETSHYRSRSASSRPDYDKAAHDGSRGLGGRKRGGFLSELFE
jgi:Zn-finger nucleic acid-binding protein